MSILIKGMEMPKSCWHCEFCRDGLDEYAQHYDYCVALDMNILISQTERHENCPLIEVPPHGRLIDANPIMKFIQDGLNNGEFGYDQIKVMGEIQYAPTVIPADKGGADE